MKTNTNYIIIFYVLVVVHLQTMNDYILIYVCIIYCIYRGLASQTHAWDDGTPIEETLSTLTDLVRQGKVRYLGLSNVTGWQLQKIIDLTKYKHYEPFVSLQVC